MHINVDSELKRKEIVLVEGGKIYLNDEKDFRFLLR